jgi:hypothetical protein
MFYYQGDLPGWGMGMPNKPVPATDLGGVLPNSR